MFTCEPLAKQECSTWTSSACWESLYDVSGGMGIGLRPSWPVGSVSAVQLSPGLKVLTRTPPCELWGSCADPSDANRETSSDQGRSASQGAARSGRDVGLETERGNLLGPDGARSE